MSRAHNILSDNKKLAQKAAEKFMLNKQNTASVIDLPSKQRVQTAKTEIKKLPILKTH